MLQATMRRLAEARSTDIEGEGAAESGFTLIELMVVLLIIAILLAIAIPTFLGVTNTAGDRAAQSNLTNALTEAKALYQVSQGYSTNGAAYTPGQFQSQAPEFTWTTGACTTSSSNCVSFLVFNAGTSPDGQGLSLAVTSAKTSTCWYAFDVESTYTATGGGSFGSPGAGVFYGRSPTSGTYAGIPSGGCVALNPNTDANVTNFSSTAGSNYSNAVSIH
jgi:prepilin-type N-terminal cleavage/methylation domain-containing protein